MSTHPYWLIIASLGAALFPIAIGLTTSYLKVSIVLGMLRSALGTQQTPSGLVVMALSAALTLYIMAPVLEETFLAINEAGIGKPGSFEKMPTEKDLGCLKDVTRPWRRFMESHAGDRELRVFRSLRKEGERKESNEPPKGEQDPITVLVPAFVVSELKEAFAMGFIVLLPFVVIDIVVANLLVGLGMYMVSPIVISLPLKLLLFTLSDAWILLTKGLIQSYGS